MVVDGFVDVTVIVDSGAHVLWRKPRMLADGVGGVAAVRSVVALDRSTGLTSTWRNDDVVAAAAEVDLESVVVVAEVRPGHPDPTSRARFTNADRAVAYAQLLVADGGYCAVWVEDRDGRHRIGGPR